MATVTGYCLHDFFGTVNDVTKPYYERLQTTGSGATMGGLEIFADPTASDNFILDSVLVNLSLASGNADVVLYGGTTILNQFATQGAASNIATYNINFGAGYLVSCTTTTATVSLMISTASCTARFVATGWRKR